MTARTVTARAHKDLVVAILRVASVDLTVDAVVRACAAVDVRESAALEAMSRLLSDHRITLTPRLSLALVEVPCTAA